MQSLVNFRDLGGYQKKVKSGKVLRSAQPVGLAETDKHILIKKLQAQEKSLIFVLERK
ncbi:hypothetical protein RyT2_15810 [Pseudolactococcus yaeyamensis]